MKLSVNSPDAPVIVTPFMVPPSIVVPVIVPPSIVVPVIVPPSIVAAFTVPLKVALPIESNVKFLALIVKWPVVRAIELPSIFSSEFT